MSTTCKRCNGTGFCGPAHVAGGRCFACQDRARAAATDTRPTYDVRLIDPAAFRAQKMAERRAARRAARTQIEAS